MQAVANEIWNYLTICIENAEKKTIYQTRIPFYEYTKAYLLQTKEEIKRIQNTLVHKQENSLVNQNQEVPCIPQLSDRSNLLTNTMIN